MKFNYYPGNVLSKIRQRITLMFLVLFYVAFTGQTSAQITTVIGAGAQSGTATNGAAGDSGPMYRSTNSSNFVYSRHHYLYTAAELAAAGITVGQEITSLAWNKDVPAETNSPCIFQVYIKNSSLTDVGLGGQLWADLINGSILAYNNASHTVADPIGWHEVNFSAPFLYTGGALEISVSFDISSGTNPWTTAGFSWKRDAITGRTLSYAGSSAPGTTLPNLRTVRPQIQITYQLGAGCTAPPVAGSATAAPSSGLCVGDPVTLDLSGNSTGAFQSYQWQSSPTSGGSYTNVGSSQPSPLLNTNATSTLFYRCAVTCSGNTQFSIPVQVVVNNGFPGGTYTINSGTATGGTNFQSFTDAVNALSCGILGPIVFNVVAGSGPYTEQISMPQIGGSSATNTITFNGNNNLLQFTPVTSARHIFEFNGADYVTLNNLTLMTLSTEFGWGVHLTNASDHNTINNCTIDLLNVTSTGATNSGGIISSGSATSVTLAGNNASFLTVSNNNIKGGIVGIILTGVATGLNAVNNQVINNTVINFYADGIIMNNNDGGLIANNDVSRPSRVVTGSFAGIELGAGCRNVVINANRIHDTHNSASSQTQQTNGIAIVSCDAPAGSENIVTNNLLYNFNSGSGVQYALYNSGSDGAYYYHNTVVLANTASTAGTTRAFYQVTAASNIIVKNNILHVTRGGTGLKHAIYFGTTASGIISDFNNFYVDAPAATTAGIGSFGTTNFATLAAWKTANSNAFDNNSFDVDPFFVNPGAGDFTPSNSSINGVGTNVGVTADINGNPRNVAAPDLGAYAFSVVGTDGSISWVSPVSPTTVGPKTIQVNVANTQSSTITSLVLGYTDGTITQSQTFSGLNILPATNQNFTFTVPYNITESVTLNAFITTVNGSPDNNTLNDTTAQSLCIALNGTYTINSGAATGGTNFQSFGDAVSALACGINGPVVFNVTTVGATYSEQITFTPVTGASAINTITINGNGNTISCTPVTSARHVIKFEGADHITINQLDLIGLSPTYGWGIHFTNDAAFNTINGCTIDLTLTTSTTSSNSGGIVGSASATSVTSAGSNSNNNTIINNVIRGAYQGIIIVGSSGGINAAGNVISGNTIVDFYSDGIILTNNDGTLVKNNDLSRPTRSTAPTAITGIEVGTGCRNVIVDGNKVHSTHTVSLTGQANGIAAVSFDAPTGEENKIINNLIYNFNGTTGTQYGLYNSSADGVQFYHNTVVLDNSSSPSGTTRGFYQTLTATNITLKNNIFYITRAGTGTKHALYFGTTTSTITSNNNVLYVNAPAGTQGAGSFGTTNFPTLANWQTADGGIYDANSVDEDPVFTDPLLGNFKPLSSGVNNMGAPVGVLTDILGDPRSAVAPDQGAYEFTVSPINFGAIEIVGPDSSGCYSPTQNITVRVKNFGSVNVDFSTLPLTVTANVTGTITATVVHVVNSGTLAPNDVMDVVIAATVNMSANGTYVINASTTIAGDSNPLNNAAPAITRNVGLINGTISTLMPEVCYSGEPEISISGNYGANIQWQISTNGPGGPWVNAGSGGTTFIPTISVNTHVRASLTCNSNSALTNVLSIIVNTPAILSTNAASRCGAGTLTLGATGAAGNTLNWYAGAVGGMPLGTGNSFTTPVVASTTNFYVGASSGGGGTATTGMTAPGPGFTQSSGFNASGTQRMYFDAYTSLTINSVVVYPNAPSNNAPGTITISLFDSTSGAMVDQLVANVTGMVQSTNPTAETVNLNFNIPTPGTYYLTINGRSVITGLMFLPSAQAPPPTTPYSGTADNYGYPYIVPGIINIKYSTIGNTIRTDLYYFFYNWTVSTGCESPRTPVLATVDPSPDIIATSDFTTICNGNTATLNVTSTNSNYSYTWSSVPAGFSATGPGPHLVPVNAPTVYEVLAVDNSSGPFAGCGAFSSVSITTVTNPLSLSVASNPTVICSGEDAQLSSLVTIPSGASSYAFSQSNGTYVPITGGLAIATATNHTSDSELSIDEGNFQFSLPFNFSYNGSNYTMANANANGYITLGSILPSATLTLPISSTTAYSGVVAAMARDLWGVYGSIGTRTNGSNTITDVTDFTEIAIGKPIRGTGIPTGATITAFDIGNETITMSSNATSTSAGSWIAWPMGEIRVQTIGTSPNRICVIQYSGFSDVVTSGTNGNKMDFQIRLHENGQIKIVYGPHQNELTTSRTQQVGLRGATNSDFNNRTSTTSWSATNAGGTNSSLVTRTNAIFAAEGLTFEWTPIAPPVVTYDWSANSNFLSSTTISNPLAQAVTSTQVYSLTITDAVTGCTKTETYTLDVDPLPDPAASSNSPVCEGQDIFLTSATGNVSYSWSGPGYSSSQEDPVLSGATLAATGTYSVTATDANGCVGTSTTAVTVNANPVMDLTITPVSCDGFNDGSVQISVNNGDQFGFYFISDEIGNFDFVNPTTFTGYSAGTYNYLVQDGNACFSSDVFTIPTVPNAAPVIVCPSDISVSASPGVCGAAVTYATPVGTDVCPIVGTTQTAGLPSGAVFPVGTTVNTFVVTDASGLTGTCSFSVTVTDDLAPVASNCPVSFSACNPVSWTAPTFADNCPGVQVVSSHTPGTVFPLGTTTVTYTATDVYNNVATCSFDVTVLPPAVGGDSITTDRDFANICAGESITLTVNGGTQGYQGQWKWYSGSCGGTLVASGTTSITVSPSATTTYYARIEGFCNTTACVQKTVTVSTGAPTGNVSYVNLPTYGAPGVIDTLYCTPVPGATYYQWSTNNGQINGVLFNGQTGPVQTSIPQVQITFVLPQSNYQIRLIAGNACGRTNQANDHIRGTVGAPTSLTGPTQVCPLQTASYTVSAVPSAGSYQWSLIPASAGTITGTGLTRSVTFAAGFTSAQLCVAGVSTFGLVGPAYCISIATNSPAPGAISGNSQPCQGTSATYTIAAVPGATGYSWTTTIAGATVNPGAGTSATINFPSGAFSGNICVTSSSTCGTSTPTCLAVTSGAPGVPGPISGPVQGICNASNVNYSLSTSDAVSYSWVLPSGATVASGGTTNSVNVNFGPSFTSGTITCIATYACGTASTSITVDGAPTTPVVTPATICPGGDAVYFASSTGATTYNWTITGADYDECTNPPSCSQYYIIWGPAGGSFSVTAQNSCGTSASFDLSTNCRMAASESQIDSRVYPNPTSGVVTVEFTAAQGTNFEMRVTDLQGRTVVMENIKSASGINRHEIDLSAYNKGIYMLHLKDSAGNTKVTRIAVQ